MPDATKVVYTGRFIDTPNADTIRIRDGAVLVSSTDGHGYIESAVWTVDEAETLKTQHESVADMVESSTNGFFFPGFIDTHIHAPQYPNAGIFGKSTLLDWLTTYTFPLESSLGSTNSPAYQNGSSHADINPLARARQVYEKVVARTLSHGTTTASYYATIHVNATNVLADVALAKGQRAYIGRVCMDHKDTCPGFYRDESTQETVTNTIASIEYCQSLDPTGELVAPIITPRFAPSCQEESLAMLGDLARDRKLRVQTHLSENVDELALVKSMFPTRKSYTDVYAHFGLLTDKTILAHAIHLSDEEIATIKSHGSKISHCPASNTALGSGLCPVRKLLEAGLDVSLGTDVSGGYSVSILESVRQCCFVSRLLGYNRGGDKKWNIGVAEALWLATVGGSKCIGMAGRTGLFELGNLWDVQQIQLENGPVDVFGWESWPEKVDKWVWNGDDRNVSKVWVGGRLVHEVK